MPDRNPNYNDDDDFTLAKGIIFVAALIIAGLLIYIVSGNSEKKQADTAPQEIRDTSGIAPTAQEPAVQNVPPPASAPAAAVPDVDIGFRVGGRIAEMLAADRTEVKAGDLLATLDPTPFERSLAYALARLQTILTEDNNSTQLPTLYFNAVEAERANIEAAQHAYNVAHEELEKRAAHLVSGELDNVYNDDVQNEHDAKLHLERAHREWAQLQYQINNTPERSDYKTRVLLARNHVADAEASLDETQLRAPISGIVTQRSGDVGAFVAAEAPLFTISASRTHNP